MMPTIGTEVKWRRKKSLLQYRRNKKTTNKTINDYSICTVHVMYSPSYLPQAQTLKNRQLSHVLSVDLVHFIFEVITCLHHTLFLAFLSHKLGCVYATLCFCTLLYCTLSRNKVVFIDKTVYSTLIVNFSWHSSESKGWHSKFILPIQFVLNFVEDNQKRCSIESGIVTRWYSNEI